MAIDRGATAFWGNPILVAGRRAREDRADEVAIDEELAQRVGLAVGDAWRLTAYRADQIGEVGRAVTARPGARRSRCGWR